MKKRTKILFSVIFCLMVMPAIFYGSVMFYINHSVEKYCEIAVSAHPDAGDEVLALIEYVNSDLHSLRERNLAVWTLGRIGDPRALETLEAAYSGGACDHDNCLCQHELSKAIKFCRAK